MISWGRVGSRADKCPPPPPAYCSSLAPAGWCEDRSRARRWWYGAVVTQQRQWARAALGIEVLRVGAATTQDLVPGTRGACRGFTAFCIWNFIYRIDLKALGNQRAQKAKKKKTLALIRKNRHSKLLSGFLFLFFFFVFLPFLGLPLWHMEVPRLGVESEL